MKERITNKSGLRTWIEISKENLKHNYNEFRKLISSDSQLMAVSKSNAYGHSLFDFSNEINRIGIDWLAVDSIVEAIRLRKEGIEKPILVLGYTLPGMIFKAKEEDISLTISSFDALKQIATLENISGLKIHLKFDTGMHRQGFFTEDAKDAFLYIEDNLLGVIIEGVYTHFASAKNPKLPNSTLAQINKFKEIKSTLNHLSNKKLIYHACATSGAIAYPGAHFDLVRIGIGMYGLWSADDIKVGYSDKIDLKPILTWKTIVGEIKTIPKGSFVGYDATEKVERETVIAILPIGYWHGYDRGLSSKGCVIINNKRAKVLGRVSMDMIVVDITNIENVGVGNEVILIGDGFGADEMAKLIDTSCYEVITRLNPLIKRLYI